MNSGPDCLVASLLAMTPACFLGVIATPGQAPAKAGVSGGSNLALRVAKTVVSP
jgi:hypothetical protein